ncbi:Glycosyltransferase involved in cell wall bisynthesis [Prevotella sp. khp1]|uniref:glycosyltransferase family 2 protein n=1 Tax=Prevotellaceae TaxID=171552 RepID=UPI0008915D3A|nr:MULTISPECIES: glycosyltransferase family 2 protein [Prevotellaceae]QVJ80367.1 glycosyltransferase family 2 protein [Xylanibacter ruminicola]SDQ23347.1 Glycosyltransferase involved in cell wall bisynthesis [Prevotella sp. khp1]
MISIALATYNGEEFLREQLDSVLNQTFQDFEIIVCDDCSKDQTLAILEEYKKRDERISVYKNDCKLGFIKNFEKAIRYCKGEYIALCDQDDRWVPEHLSILLNIIGDKPIACGNARFIDRYGNDLRSTLIDRDHLVLPIMSGTDLLYRLFFYRNTFQGASMLINRKFLEVALPIPEVAKYHDLWLSILSCMYGGLAFTSEIVNEYRQHGNNYSNSSEKGTNRYKHFCYTLLINVYSDYRMDIINELLSGRFVFPDKNIELIKIFKEKLINARSIFGRFWNIPFLVAHLKKIYC